MGDPVPEPEHWMVGNIAGMGDCIFEAETALPWKDANGSMRIRRVCRLDYAADRRDPNNVIVTPVPWLPTMVKAVGRDEWLVVHVSRIGPFGPATAPAVESAKRVLGLKMIEEAIGQAAVDVLAAAREKIQRETEARRKS